MMFTNKTYPLWLILLAIISLLGLGACAAQESPPPDPYAEYAVPSPQALSLDEFLAGADSQQPYLQQLSYAPTEAKYFDLVNQTLSLNQAELALLKQNGFVVSDRLTFADFTTAYAYIYWKDLPVLVTTDSMLQAVHQIYDDLLIQLEETSFTARLTTLLTQARQQLLAEARTNNDPDLASLYTDLEIYLTVPLSLLTGQQYDTPGLASYLELAQSADKVAEIDLFGSRRVVDFTLFKPRGHYTESETLARYFRAVSWLALVDFRLVEYSPDGDPTLNLEQLAAAVMLREAIDGAGQRPAWTKFEAFFSAFFGRSDNVTLSDLDRFLVDAELDSAADLMHYPDSNHLLTLLTSRDYGQQRITAQILNAAPDMPNPAPRPVSFMLLGQRFSVDAYLMSNLVYDRLLVDGQKVERPMPSPLDVMYILGNDRAATHLQDELAQYGYQGHLAALRHGVNDYDPNFWTGSVYNRWLGLLRTLNVDTTGTAYPQAMRTPAWADKMLHTQLASWTQLRHDNILYVKQSFSANLCQYPAGYVEPYPEFYATLRDNARASQRLIENLDPASLTPAEARILPIAIASFDHLAAVAGQLQILAEKELRLEPFSPDEEAFLERIAVYRPNSFYTPQWTGWYPELFPEYKRGGFQTDRKDKSPALVADIHTDPGGGLFRPPSVLHVATGPVATIIFIADTDEGPTMYVGPVFTYFEIVKTGFFTRLTDQDWRRQLNSGSYPTAPAWTGSFRVPASGSSDYLEPR